MSRVTTTSVENAVSAEISVGSDDAAENAAEIEDTSELQAERREREERNAADMPDRAFERITPQV